MNYPFVESIKSTLNFAEEVIVYDSGKPHDYLEEIKKIDSRVIVCNETWDWSVPNHGVYDGMTKAKARSLCSGEYLVQFDSDELFHEDHTESLLKTITNFDHMISSGRIPPETICSLPVVEFWGKHKVRLDINLQKPRVSRNIPEITHGVPRQLRKYKNGLLYACHGTDSCDFINSWTYEPLMILGCIPQEIYSLQQAAKTDKNASLMLEKWFNQLVETTPGVFHYSWVSIERKIKQYKLFWTEFWKALYDENRDPKNNPFFPGKTWDEITDQEIKEMALRLETETSGWIFHQPWDGSQINGIKINKPHPVLVNDWLNKL
jgi:hypothetical protein